MNNQSKKLQNLRENSEAIFQELFGLGKKKAPENGPVYRDDEIYIDGLHRMIFPKTNSTIEKPLPNYGEWTQLDWRSEDLNWLVNSNFQAKSASINRNEKIEQFRDCIWAKGDFRGGKFIGGQFNGGTFVGQFGPGAKWNVSPFNFIDGTTKETETILGLPNISNLRKDKFKFNIIAVTPGNDITINLVNGITHKISVLKRLDARNSVFSYEVTNGANKEKKPVNLKWSQLRGQNATEFQSNTVFATNAIPGVFTKFFMLPFESPIKDIEIDSSQSFEQPKWTEKEETPADLSKKQVSYELSRLPLGITSIPRKGEGKETTGSVYFNFPSATEQAGFNEVVKALDKNWLNAYIKKVKAALDNGVITEIPAQYPYLANLMKSDIVAEAAKLQAAAPLIDQDTQNALLGIENFLKYFVGTMVRRFRKSGAEKGLYDVEDTVGRNAIKSKIKSLLSSSITPGQPKQKVQSANPSKPLKKIKMAESKSVKDYILKILSENLKHF